MNDTKLKNRSNGWSMALFVAALVLIATVSQSQASTSLDYCINPPLLGSPPPPNLLLMLDNSSSMYDLTYVDKGKFSGTCSITTTSTCSETIACPSGETCTNITFTSGRDPYYCYDQTYISTNTYVGYFDKDSFYKYNDAGYFEAVAALPAGCTGAGCVYLANTLCIDGTNLTTTTTPKSITAFYAKGSYLNWLTASKFDVQKQILTGGKYLDKICSGSTDNNTVACSTNADCPQSPTAETCSNDLATNVLQAESRGCVGRSFVKEALTADFVNYSSPETNNTNTGLKITFGIRGPLDATNASAPSPGGQTYIDIYAGADYNQALCQDAIDAFADPDCNHQCQRVAAEACLASLDPSADTSLETKEKVVFQQTVQECWQYSKSEPKTVGTDAVTTVKNQCPPILKRCSISAPSNAGGFCTKKADCGSSSDDYCTDYDSPSEITPGNPALLCSSSYAGYCFENTTATSYTWIKQEYATDSDCIKAKHNEFCGSFDQPQVIDPTDDPSVTTDYSNLPALLSDIGLQGQLDKPVKTLTVRLKASTEPKGLIKDFENVIRMGVMSFNFNGSKTECDAGLIPCPKTCSTDRSKVCGSKLDCPSPETATCDINPVQDNFDGAKILHDVGKGKCSVTTSKVCTTDENCPASEKCNSNGVGTAGTGLVKTINDIRGSTWTPFAEGLYSAMGYFAPLQRCSVSINTSCTADTDCPATERCKYIGRTALRINSTDFDEKMNPSMKKCQKNNVLLVSDGMSTADRHSSMMTVADLYAPSEPGQCSITSTKNCTVNADCPAGETCGAAQTGACDYFAGSKNLDDLTWIAKNRKLSDFALSGTASAAPVSPPKNESISTYVVFNGAGNSGAGDCNSENLLTNAATKGGTTIRKAEKPEQLTEALRNSFLDIAAGTVSGTAASVLASGEGSGANLIQAVFFPTKKFGATDITWLGKLSNFWYYVDPNFTNSNIREDDGNKVLTLKTAAAADPPVKSDYISQFYFDANSDAAMAKRWSDTNADAIGDAELAKDVLLENVGNLWEAGKLLWARTAESDDTIASKRKIYTANLTSTATTTNLMEFRVAYESTLRPYLQAVDSNEGSAIIWYTRGYDSVSFGGSLKKYVYRNRSVKVDLNGDGDTLDTVTLAGGSISENIERPWKLGDVLNSTPKISSWMPLNSYHKTYLDSSYGVPGKDTPLGESADNTRYTTSEQYKKRGVVFAGANDGMLHAFKLGRLELSWSERDNITTMEKARLINPDTGMACNEQTDAVPCGTELWAYIPKNVLPYLKHMAETGYCHNFSVDLTPFVFDASIGAPGSGDVSTNTRTAGAWRTIVIGGMRLGGACKDTTYSGTDGVKVPTTGKGYSSYFALDVTDQNNPVLLWEFSHVDLGFATSGPSVVRIHVKDGSTTPPTPLTDRNGKWFVVFGSGPTGPIDSAERQFMGRSDQELKIFVLDLKTGNLVATLPTGIANAFAGSIFNSTHDIDLDYQDDVIYVPYVSKASDGTWTDGGVLRVLTGENTTPSIANWPVSTVIKGIGPVTSAVSKLQNTKTNHLWLYFGTGRYFFEKYLSADDPTNMRHIVGIKDACFAADGSGFQATCPAEATFCASPDTSSECGGLKNADDVTAANAFDPVTIDGWYLNLENANTYTYLEGKPAVSVSRKYRAERVITDPLAVSTGVVFYTTYKPYDEDPCRIGGKTFIWAVKYDTGGAAETLLKGKALVQVSTGSIEQIDLGQAFTEKGKRRSSAMEGVPPTAQGLSVMSSPPPVKRVVHIKER